MVTDTEIEETLIKCFEGIIHCDLTHNVILTKHEMIDSIIEYLDDIIDIKHKEEDYWE